MSLDTFGETLSFLSKHAKFLLLKDASGKGRVAVFPGFAGRVMASSYSGDSGPSLGWINREVVAGKRDPQFVNFGGAERLWISPEGGQYAPFFKPGVPFEFANWRVPSSFNDEPFNVASSGPDRAAMTKELEVVNYLGTRMRLRLDRTLSVLDSGALGEMLGVSLPEDLNCVGYRSDNALTNKGSEPMTRDNGLLSLWVLYMFVPSGKTVVMLPVHSGGTGPVVIDDYFGKVPAGRLVYLEDQACVIFKADGQERGKIGLPASRARDLAASLDYENGILTVVRFSRPREGQYLRNSWQIHKDPFGGDVINSYNDGPPEPGLPPLGGFYELENLSPARELGPGESLKHWSAVVHINGPLERLGAIARGVLGVDIGRIPEL